MDSVPRVWQIEEIMKSTTARCKEVFEKTGWNVDVVEKWIHVPNHPGGGVRRDLFGIIDAIAIKTGVTVGIQATTYSNISSHITKMNESPMLMKVLQAGWSVQLWGWRKKAGRWIAKIIHFYVDGSMEGSYWDGNSMTSK